VALRAMRIIEAVRAIAFARAAPHILMILAKLVTRFMRVEILAPRILILFAH
jgi:hypothetical protein